MFCQAGNKTKTTQILQFCKEEKEEGKEGVEL